MRIQNCVLPNKDPKDRYDVEYSKNGIESVTKITSSTTDAPPTLILPALCHPHIHLDKAFLLTSHSEVSTDAEYPDYSDLGLKSGDFQEALSKTSQAKKRYTVPDLKRRGGQLILESVQAGVTSMRAFAEVDHVTGLKCVDAARGLRAQFAQYCHVQICAFAQDPIMSTVHGQENRRLMEEALNQYPNDIEVVGTTPYVEESMEAGIDNIKWAIRTALERDLHVDFHLDYNVNSKTDPLIWDAIRLLKEANWIERAKAGRRIVFGHCTRTTLFSQEEMQTLVQEVGELPITFVALPTSDLFMMGRPGQGANEGGRRERGTLQVIDMIQKYDLKACIGVNNVGNAFTPWGGVDPLRLASLGVGLYHAGTAQQAKILYQCVSTRARDAIGLQSSEAVTEGERHFDSGRGGVLMIENEAFIQCPGIQMEIAARPKLTVTDVVWDPPELRLRRALNLQE